MLNALRHLRFGHCIIIFSMFVFEVAFKPLVARHGPVSKGGPSRFGDRVGPPGSAALGTAPPPGPVAMGF